LKRRLYVFATVSALVVGAAFVWLAVHDGQPLDRTLLAALVGMFCGVVCAGLITLVLWFLGRLSGGAPSPIALFPGEERLRELRANHLTKEESRGGRLLLTNQRVVFHPHRFATDQEPLVLPIAEIDEVRVSPEQLALVARGEVFRLLVTLSSDADLEALGAQLASMVQASRRA